MGRTRGLGRDDGIKVAMVKKYQPSKREVERSLSVGRMAQGADFKAAKARAKKDNRSVYGKDTEGNYYVNANTRKAYKRSISGAVEPGMSPMDVLGMGAGALGVGMGARALVRSGAKKVARKLAAKKHKITAHRAYKQQQDLTDRVRTIRKAKGASRKVRPAHVIDRTGAAKRRAQSKMGYGGEKSREEIRVHVAKKTRAKLRAAKPKPKPEPKPEPTRPEPRQAPSSRPKERKSVSVQDMYDPKLPVDMPRHMRPGKWKDKGYHESDWVKHRAQERARIKAKADPRRVEDHAKVGKGSLGRLVKRKPELSKHVTIRSDQKVAAAKAKPVGGADARVAAARRRAAAEEAGKKPQKMGRSEGDWWSRKEASREAANKAMKDGTFRPSAAAKADPKQMNYEWQMTRDASVRGGKAQTATDKELLWGKHSGKSSYMRELWRRGLVEPGKDYTPGVVKKRMLREAGKKMPKEIDDLTPTKAAVKTQMDKAMKEGRDRFMRPPKGDK